MNQTAILAALAGALLAATSAAAGQAPATPASASPATPAAGTEFLIGGDVTLLARIEELGGVYRDAGRPRDALDIFRSRGWNCLRLRLWNSPSGKNEYVSNLEYTTTLARRIKAAGFQLLLDFHYSDTWADPGNQAKPAAWKDLTFDPLQQAVYEYSRQVITSMKAAGACPDIVQVGNEITPGMLWPDGKIGAGPRAFANLAALVKAGIRGVRDGAGADRRIQIMIHADCGGDRQRTQWFFDGLAGQGVEFDLIGLSFYPVWHGTPEDLRRNIEESAARYRKPVVTVEVSYPWRGGDRKGNQWAGSGNKVLDKYPLTPEGQRQYLADLLVLLRKTPGSRGCIYWAPEWIPVKGMASSWGDLTLFDHQGNALPGLDAFRGTPAAAPAAGAKPGTAAGPAEAKP